MSAERGAYQPAAHDERWTGAAAVWAVLAVAVVAFLVGSFVGGWLVAVHWLQSRGGLP